MKKNLITLGIVALLVMATVTVSSAALISTDLTSDSYITVGGLDWAWASPVNIQYFPPGAPANELMAPEYHDGWRFATVDELASHPLLAAFTRGDGSFIVASAYWNTFYTHVDSIDFSAGLVRSTWATIGSPYDDQVSETLYVRNHSVPEPGTMLLLGSGLLGLIGCGRRRMKK